MCNYVTFMKIFLIPSPLVTSLLAGTIGDKFGRKRTLFYGATVFVIGGGIQTGSTSFEIMVLGRIISGFGVGLLSMIVPIVS